jgi:predicted nucleotidyltransferase
LIEQYRQQISELCRRHQVKRLELFGSAARGEFEPGRSDLDFLVEFVSYQSPTIADDWFGLQEELEQLLGTKVDFTSARAARNPYFLEMVSRDRVTLFCSTGVSPVSSQPDHRRDAYAT